MDATGLALVALVAFLVARNGGLAGGSGAPGSSGGPFGNVPDGTFTPQAASRMPDFDYATEGYDGADAEMRMFLPGPHDQDPDWADFIRIGAEPRGVDEDLPGQPHTALAYYLQLWRPASRISLETITKGDIDRAGQFLAGAWKKGAAAGMPKQLYDLLYDRINEYLESEAEGLDVGAKIGIGLASIFGFGAGAAAADASFGFGRGASEDRSAMVNLTDVAAGQKDVGLANAFAIPKTNPAGVVRGREQIRVSGQRVVGCYPNLFYPLYKVYDDGFASGSVPGRQRITGLDGNDYIKVGLAYPWWSSEMGAALTRRERFYVRARMLRVLDLIRCVLYPRLAEFASVGNLAGFVEGSSESLTTQAPVSYDVSSPRFGVLRGSIFPQRPDSGAVAGPGAGLPPARGALDTYMPSSSSPAPALPVAPTTAEIASQASVLIVPPAPAPAPTASNTSTDALIARLLQRKGR